MKYLILLSMLCLTSSASFAQSLSVVSTFPENGATGVETDSIVLEFNLPVFIDINSEDPSESGFNFAVEPEDSVSFDSLTISNDGLRVTLFAEFADSTDYLAVLFGISGSLGEKLDSPYIFQFTTSATAGEYVVKGALTEDQLKAIDHESRDGLAVILSTTPPDFEFIDDEDGEGDECGEECLTEEEESEDDVIPVYAALVDTLTGEYEISGVREGTYYPLGYDLFEIAEQEDHDDEEIHDKEGPGDGGDFIPTLYYYDENGDYSPDYLEVNSTEAPTDTLSEIDLELLDFSPFTIDEAFYRASAFLDVEELDVEILGGGTQYYFFTESEPDFKSVFNPKAKRLKTMEDEPFYIYPDGYNIVWQVFAYDAVKDSALTILVTPIGSFIEEYFGEDDAEEGVEFDDIKSLPEDYLDSDSAAYYIDLEGGEAFRDKLADIFEGSDYSWEMRMQLLHSYWDFPPNPTPTAPVTWVGEYRAFGYDYFEDEYYELEFIVYLDAETGELLYSFETEIPEPGVLSVLETSPENGAFAVDTDSIVITFDTKINLDFEEDFEETNFGFFVQPFDSVEYTGLALSEDSMSVIVYVDLADDTDYFAVIEDAEGLDGERLKRPYLFSFTTADTPGQFVVQGTLSPPMLEKVLADNGHEDVLVILAPEALAFEIDIDGDEGDGEDDGECTEDCDEDEGLDFIPLYAAFVDTLTGDYEISGVREGVYYPTGIGTEDEFDDFGPQIFFYDEDDNFVPDAINLNETDVPSDTLTGIDLRPLEFTPFTFNESLDRSKSLTDTFSDTVLFMGGSTEINILDTSFENDSEPETILSKLKHMEEPFIFNGLDGRSPVWQQFYYDQEINTAFFVASTPLGSFIADSLTEEEADIPVSLETLKPAPATSLDSDSVLFIANENGGSEFVDSFEESTPVFAYVSAQLFHEYWLFEPNPTPDAPVFWKVDYRAEYFDQETFEFWEDSVVIFMDAVTGEVLHSVVPVSNEVSPELPNEFQLLQNYPNPFNPSTNIPFTLGSASRVELNIYNLLGQKVATLTDDLYNAGSHTLKWNAQGFASGVYIYQLKANGTSQTKKLILLK